MCIIFVKTVLCIFYHAQKSILLPRTYVCRERKVVAIDFRACTTLWNVLVLSLKSNLSAVLHSLNKEALQRRYHYIFVFIDYDRIIYQVLSVKQKYGIALYLCIDVIEQSFCAEWCSERITHQVPSVIVLHSQSNRSFAVTKYAFVLHIQSIVSVNRISHTRREYQIWIDKVFAPIISVFAHNTCVVFHQPSFVSAFSHRIYQCSCLIYR